ncbi:hypothetical protein MKJ04_15205 [Pontibacter sp. E15-1]|uniref:hypothetical protein n=1 Tax=Pontibacter sp. E15-1 TaxID=2919918 RepID=UPI001F4F74CC|nr:hypothetical protein [Pontibacter sp. E15-1]MCJ8166194.1 hypothetical protein [Pontibacter sp. E15-1]
MKHAYLCASLFLGLSYGAAAQSTPGPVEMKMTENICSCISELDFDQITTKQLAEKAFMDCFSEQGAMLLQLAEERHIDITDHPAMRTLGTELGKNLLAQNCPGFMKLSMAMVKDVQNGVSTGTTEGKLKRMDTKDFNYFVLTDNENMEKSFIWLRQFPGSENYMSNPQKFIGKKFRIKWQDVEVYVPNAKSYYTIKEVVGLEVL